MRFMTFKCWLARACSSMHAFLCQWSTVFPSSHRAHYNFDSSQDSIAIGSCYKDGCWHVRTDLLGTEMRTTAHFSMATKHLSDVITNPHLWSGPVCNGRLGVKSLYIPFLIPCSWPFRPKHTNVPWQSSEIQQLVTLVITLKTIVMGRSCSCVEWLLNVLALWKVQVTLTLNHHSVLATDGKDCACLGKSVGKKGFTLPAADHPWLPQHRNF